MRDVLSKMAVVKLPCHAGSPERTWPARVATSQWRRFGSPKVDMFDENQ